MKNIDGLIEILTLLKPDVKLVYLFGSQARGDSNSESDIDIAALFESPLGLQEVLELEGRLSDHVKKEVDLLDLGSATDVMKYQVLLHGVPLYRKSKFLQDEFEMYALSDYVRLNEERAGIIKDFYQRNTK